MKLGLYLKHLRQDAGLTQEELGNMLIPNIKKSAIAKWETGRVENIRADHIQQLAKIYGISPSSLVMYNVDLDDTILGKYKQLDAFDQGKLMGYADMLLDQEKYKK